jgi:Site-specific recombinase XerD
MRMAVADIHTVAELLGHKDLAAVKRYQRLSPAFLAEVVGKLDAVPGPALGPKSAENGQKVTRTLPCNWR